MECSTRSFRVRKSTPSATSSSWRHPRPAVATVALHATTSIIIISSRGHVDSGGRRRGQAMAATWAAGAVLGMDPAKKAAALVVVLLVCLHGARRVSRGGSSSCESLFSSGRHLSNGMWQPEGCMVHHYTQREVKECLEEKYVVFMGDSRIRMLYQSYLKFLTPTPPNGAKWQDIQYRESNPFIKVDFLWAPDVGESMTKHFASWKMPNEITPDVIVMGAATWAIKLTGDKEEGLVLYQRELRKLKSHMINVTRASHKHRDVIWVLQDPVDEAKLHSSRKLITNRAVEKYNDVTMSVLEGSPVRIMKASRQVAQHYLHLSDDGLHIPDAARSIVSSLILNSHCNRDVRPLDGSCCSIQRDPTLIQAITALCFLGFAVAWAATCVRRASTPPPPPPQEDVETALVADTPPVIEKLEASHPVKRGAAEEVLASLTKLGFIMAYFYLCDRANWFYKEHKDYHHSLFFVPLAVIMVLGWYFSKETKDTVLLNRDQTEEWKGWMQLIILIYHFSGASSFLPVYLHVRLLVAAYLFQTGYGHFSFFWAKGDFGLFRVCQVMFRMNFLTVLLCLVMDHHYQFYYFVPLVSFWFLVMYGTLAVPPRITAKDGESSVYWKLLMVLKLLMLCTCIVLLALSQEVFEGLFVVWPVSELFMLQGSLHEWWFRCQLDRFAVLFGMLFAFAYLMMKRRGWINEANLESLFPRWLSTVLLFFCISTIVGYTVWSSRCSSKAECNQIHPYTSLVHILAFVFVRNIPGYARSMYSTFFAWFGKFSLELFICQYHVWLAADTRGILVLVPGGWVLPNAIVTTFIFVCVAHEVSAITGVLAQHLVPKEWPALRLHMLLLAISLGLLLLLQWLQNRVWT
ncbi:N-acetylneuraminate 9-O-acetyltransferase-like [Lethenteron reissneri]|uniref:N-acetylneuraminate 9-O-acetyltransferase-like n=1 Tax=Lethenteron reissneri TaxID=7753 RepID=UPI002AB7ECD7|nr:N-acetylneuraminate 9-O-acetyltransferase-like [Lethenteron reissneri]